MLPGCNPHDELQFNTVGRKKGQGEGFITTRKGRINKANKGNKREAEEGISFFIKFTATKH